MFWNKNKITELKGFELGQLVQHKILKILGPAVIIALIPDEPVQIKVSYGINDYERKLLSVYEIEPFIEVKN